MISGIGADSGDGVLAVVMDGSCLRSNCQDSRG
jgi:hypothetical protein